MAVLQSGDGTSNLANVDANKRLLVNLPDAPDTAGYARIVDTDGRTLDTTENGYLRTSTVALSLYDQIEGSAVNTNLWNVSDVLTQTITQAGGFINLNAGGSIAANTYANLVSNKVIPLYGSLPFIVELTASVQNLPAANSTAEIGIGTVSHGTVPGDGAFFRWSPAGGFYAVINNGTSEASSANLAGQTFTDTDGSAITMPPTVIVNHLYAIEIVEDHVLFSVDDIQVADIQVPSGQAYPFNAGRQQIFARTYIGASSPSLAPKIMIGQLTAKYEDLQQYRQWGEVLASMGRSAYQSPITPFAQNANHANSTSPVSATLSNGTPGYTTLGGRFQFAAVGSAVTDFALFGFQIPTGFQLFINSLSISTISMGALGNALTPTIFDWGVGVNSSVASLGTVDSYGTGVWGPRRIPLGMQTFGLTTAIGAAASDITRRFETPLIVDSGRFFHIILQIPLGVATASQIFRGDIVVNGFFE